MTAPQRTAQRDQREARAADDAHVAAAFYETLRKRRVPPAAAQALAESYVQAMCDELPPEPWQG